MFSFHKKYAVLYLLITLFTGCSNDQENTADAQDHVEDNNTSEISFADSVQVAGPLHATLKILIGKIDDDQDIDLIAVNQGSASVVYLNNDAFAETDNFTPIDIDPANGSINQPLNGDIGDVNGDLKPDFVAANQNGPNYLYINNGLGNFSSRIPIDTDNDLTRTIALADLDKNGILDVYAGNHELNRTYLNDGSANFSAATDIGTNTDDSWVIKFADVNADLAVDMIVSNGPSGICIYKNNGSGKLSDCILIATVDFSRAFDIEAGDVDGDSDIDLLISYQNGTVGLLTNDGAGNFNEAISIDSSDTIISDVLLSDINGDGHLDLITGSIGFPVGEGNNYIKIHLNDGLGSFDTGIKLDNNTESTFCLGAGDLDRDGDQDLISCRLSGIMVYENLLM